MPYSHFPGFTLASQASPSRGYTMHNPLLTLFRLSAASEQEFLLIMVSIVIFRYKEGDLNVGENSCVDRCASKYWQVTGIVGQLLGGGQ
jgi:hypothetical protein